MQVAVWDTYVKSRSGTVLHFDIIVPESVKDADTIYNFGTRYLSDIGEQGSQLSTNECRFCHIEEPAPEVLAAIENKGYYILEMDAIPSSLGTDASRRDKIMYLKGHYPKFRFQSFKGVPEDEVNRMLSDTGE